MVEGRLGFMSRLWMFFWLPFKALFDPAFAWRVEKVLPAGSLPALAPAAAPAAAVKAPEAPKPAAVAVEKPKVEEKPKVPDTAQALHVLSILQRDGRLIDFLQEEIASATDDQVGAAARIVHEGCRKALAQYFTLEPVRKEAEGAAIVVPEGFDPAQIRLTGNVAGKPPFRGHLAHAGWRAAQVKLPPPPASQDPAVIAPAEVEL